VGEAEPFDGFRVWWSHRWAHARATGKPSLPSLSLSLVFALDEAAAAARQATTPLHWSVKDLMASRYLSSVTLKFSD
jgi:hypothetical protein